MLISSCQLQQQDTNSTGGWVVPVTPYLWQKLPSQGHFPCPLGERWASPRTLCAASGCQWSIGSHLQRGQWLSCPLECPWGRRWAPRPQLQPRAWTRWWEPWCRWRLWPPPGWGHQALLPSKREGKRGFKKKSCHGKHPYSYAFNWWFRTKLKLVSLFTLLLWFL